MSLFIVGSLSRITRGIINTLVQRNLYGKIIVGDLFPAYAAFQRYYRLREELAEIKSGSTLVKPVKLLEQNDIHLWSKRADQILYVTHDYYVNVTSKTRLMEMVADAAKEKPNVLYVTPAEYDHYAYDNPAAKYQEAVKAVQTKCPQATILRSDIVAGAEFTDFMTSEKGVWDKWAFNGVSNERFSPMLVRQQILNDAVAEILLKGVTGKQYFIRGETEVSTKQLPAAAKPYKNSTGLCQSSHFAGLFQKYSKEFVQQGEELKPEHLQFQQKA